jgi:hypothetical protein
MLGAYVAYDVLLVFFTRKYLAGVGRTLVHPALDREESVIRRAGTGLVALALAGFLAWGHWLGMSLVGSFVLTTHVVLLGFLAAKLRAECGLPYGAHNHPLGQSHYEGPLPVFLLIPLVGGMPFLGGEAVMVMTLVTAIVLPFSFFNVPGLQVELLEVGRRFGIRPVELGVVAVLGVLLAVVVGGWVYLTTLYGFGASRLPVAGDFGDKIGAFKTFNAELSAAQSALDGAGQAGAAAATEENRAPYYAMAFGAAVASAVAVLRQLFPGFWFHPIGVLVGPSNMMSLLWGSLLVAGIMRFGVLKIGGASAVRSKLVPAAVGIFLAALAAYAIATGINAYYFFFNKGNVKFRDFILPRTRTALAWRSYPRPNGNGGPGRARSGSWA